MHHLPTRTQQNQKQQTQTRTQTRQLQATRTRSSKPSNTLLAMRQGRDTKRPIHRRPCACRRSRITTVARTSVMQQQTRQQNPNTLRQPHPTPRPPDFSTGVGGRRPLCLSGRCSRGKSAFLGRGKVRGYKVKGGGIWVVAIRSLMCLY